MDTGHCMENIVYYELRERELAPLRKIRDNYEKIVLTGQSANQRIAHKIYI